MSKILFLDKHGWPVETIKGHYCVNFLRILIHARKIVGKDKWYQRRKVYSKSCITENWQPKEDTDE